MKIRIQFPEEVSRNEEKARHYVDDILLWGMEVEMDVEFYGFWREPDAGWYNRNAWKYGVFIVEKVSAFMFSLKWGALQHKPRKKHKDYVFLKKEK